MPRKPEMMEAPAPIRKETVEKMPLYMAGACSLPVISLCHLSLKPSWELSSTKMMTENTACKDKTGLSVPAVGIQQRNDCAWHVAGTSSHREVEHVLVLGQQEGCCPLVDCLHQLSNVVNDLRGTSDQRPQK